MGTDAPHVMSLSLRDPLIIHCAARCRDCLGCVHVCPVRAIRMVDGRPEVITEKCVKCGLCVNECGNHAYVVRDDVPDVVELLRGPRPVVALLATEFTAALHPFTTMQIERSLELLGFHAVESTLLGEEIVAREYERLHARPDMLFILRSTCPVVTDFVRTYYPEFAPALAPVVPPYIAQARLIKELYKDDIAVVYVSPCYARKDEAISDEFGGAVDAAIDFLELKRLLDGLEDVPTHGRAAMVGKQRSGLLKEISLTDGFPRQTLTSRDMTDTEVHVVRGIEALERLLRAMSSGEIAPAIVDMLNCEGCIDGPAVSPGLSLFAKRNIESAANAASGKTHVSTRALLGVLPTIDTMRSFSVTPVVVPIPTQSRIDEILAEGGFMSREDALDCGACGFSTCVEHAIAIHQGGSTWEMCFPLQRRRLRDAESSLETLETLDPVTGLWNVRIFGERLALEMARYARYQTPVSLVVMDVDSFGEVNDSLGEAVGDRVLRALGERLATQLRSTDMLARHDGDRFAVLLPGIGKTAAYAVAEKLKDVAREEPVRVEGDGYTHEVSLTLSVGVTSASPAREEPLVLLETAEAALIEAMAAGNDQARLAPG
ncbi:MAG: diguanylate cyclase [Coriobacteriia bacterium]|nr:diguanylate cyclase [Coriobacteriia bacterium]